MKKRILIFAVIATMLMTMLALPTFADEAYAYDGYPYYVARITDLSVFDDIKEFTIQSYLRVTVVTATGQRSSMDNVSMDGWLDAYTTTNGGVSYGDDQFVQGPGIYYGAEDDGFIVNGSVVYSYYSEEFDISNGGYLELYLSPYGYPDLAYVENDDYEQVVDYGSAEFYELDSVLDAFAELGIEFEYVSGGASSGLVPSIFEGFGAAIGGIAGGLKAAFNSVVYTNGASGAFSPLVIFVFTMAGLGLATGILYKIFGMIRARKG